MSYDPLLLVRTIPRCASSGSGMFSTPADTVWYQRSFGVASSSCRTRRGLLPLNATRVHRGSEALLVADREDAIVRESRRDGLGRRRESRPHDDIRHRLRILRTLVAALSGTLLNAATVLIGGLLGTALGDRLPARLRENVVRGLGLIVLAMGVKFAIETSN